MKRFVPALLFFPLAAFLAGCGMTKLENTKKIQDNLTQALTMAQQDRTTEARQWADRAIAVDPNSIGTYIFVGADDTALRDLSIADVFQAVGDDPSLTYYLTQAHRQFPNAYQPLALLVEAEDRLGDTADKKANAAALAALIEKKIGTPGTTNYKNLITILAQAYWDAGDTVKGEEKFKGAIATYPDEPNNYNGLAYDYAVADRKPDLPQALADAQKAIALAKRLDAADETISAYQDTLGWVFYRMGRYSEAEFNLLQALDAAPRQAETRYHLGMVYLAEGKTEAAAAEFTHAMLLSKGYADPAEAMKRLKSAGGTPTPAPG